jgi:ligand-binding SRPBCC domain-containing protein
MYSIKAVQFIPVTIQEVWSFFATPANLHLITPPNMGFTVLTPLTDKSIYPGQTIEYKVRPLLGIPLYWMTEITSVKEEMSFIDEQRKGPFRLWKHQHYFKPVEGGVEMRDVVEYQLPLWILGNMIHTLTVKNKLLDLFQYRFAQIEKVLGKWEGHAPNIHFT